jgi:hypothetical protein
MDDLSDNTLTKTGIVEVADLDSNVFMRKLDVGAASVESLEIEQFEAIASSSALIDENYFNRQRLRLLRQQFTNELLDLIQEEDFEYGMQTRADELVRQHMMLNHLATKSWLNSIFVESFTHVPVLLGLLRIVARINYVDIYPEGQTMALAALSHRDTSVKECGVRAFESWESIEGLKILENLSVTPQWLQEYIDQVVSDLRSEYDVPIGEEDRQG